MTKPILALALAAAVLAMAAQAQTNVYRWTDKDGKVHFSDAPPPDDAKGASQRRFGGGPVDDTQLPFATQQAMKKSPVTLYTGTQCGAPCTQGRDLLARRGIPFTEKDAQNNAAERDALKKLVGTLEVPVLVVGDSKTKGWDESMWHAALDSAGYPRTRLPGQAPLPQPVVPTAPPKAPAPETQPPGTAK